MIEGLNQVFRPDSQTDVEINTGASFTGSDGVSRTIFVKVLDTGAMPNNDISSISLNISNLNRFISLTGEISNGTSHFFLPYVDETASSECIRVRATNSKLFLSTGIDFSAFSGTLRVYYTKT